VRIITNLRVIWLSITRPPGSPSGAPANRFGVVLKTDEASEPSEREFVAIKVDAVKRLMYGIVYAPGLVDAQGDMVEDPAIIEKAAHDFLLNGFGRNVDVIHDLNARNAGVVESWIVRNSMTSKDGIFPLAPDGSWAVGIKVNDEELWNQIAEGRLGGISLMGSLTSVEGGNGMAEEAGKQAAEGSEPSGSAAKTEGGDAEVSEGTIMTAIRKALLGLGILKAKGEDIVGENTQVSQVPVEEFQAIKKAVEDLKASKTDEDVKGLKGVVEEIQATLKTIKETLAGLATSADVSAVSEAVKSVEGKVATVETAVKSAEEKIGAVDERVKAVEGQPLGSKAPVEESVAKSGGKTKGVFGIPAEWQK
jgi:hypothetical protein